MQAAEEQGQRKADRVASKLRPVLPAWLTASCRVLAWAIALVTCLMAMSMSEQAAGGHAVPDVLMALGATLLVLFLTVLIHEGGHAIGAGLAGMKVIIVHAGPLELRPWGNAFRWRFRRPKGPFGGFVVAFPDPGRSIRSAFMRFVSGGPLANLAAAAMALLPAWLWNGPSSGFFAAFALVNAGIGIANLLPFGRGYSSDGLSLVMWWKRWRDDSPELAYTKLMGLSAFGTAAERLPSELVESLEEQGPVHRLVAAWLHLKAAQNQCLWGKVDQVEAEIKSIVAPLPETMLAAISELLVMLRIEIAFSRAMHERSAEPIRGIRFGKGVDWLAPHLRPRFAALDAALAGDSANSARFLNQALRYAEASPDMALRESESRMAEAIRALRPA